MNAKVLQNITKSMLLAGVAVFMAVILVAYPEEALSSSIRGLKIWWEVVFPALLPFFITAEMLMGFGVVHFLGVLLEPLMRPIFRVPGSGAFVMTVGLISGNPMGAKLTAKLREQRLVTREEGERLVSFTSTAGPLFIFGAVGVGFFESSAVGIILAIAHYAGSLAVGLLMRFYQAKSASTPPYEKQSGFLLRRAFRALHQARVSDGRTVGRLLGEAVTSAVQTLLLIGGFIMIFSVITHLITHIGIAKLLSQFLAFILAALHIPTELSTSMFTGLFEMTLGSQLASTSSAIPLLFQLTIVSVLIGFNGLSIHAQVVSMLSRTDIRYTPYFCARILHGFISGLVTLLIFHPLQPYLSSLPAFLPNMHDTYTTANLWLWKSLQLFALSTLILWIGHSLYRYLIRKSS